MLSSTQSIRNFILTMKYLLEIGPCRYEVNSKVAGLYSLVNDVNKRKLSNEILKARIKESKNEDIRNTFLIFFGTTNNKAIKLLIENGMDVNIKDKNGDTPIEKTILRLMNLSMGTYRFESYGPKGIMKEIELCNLLLEQGADLNSSKKFRIYPYYDDCHIYFDCTIFECIQGLLDSLDLDKQRANRDKLIGLLGKNYYKLNSNNKSIIKKKSYLCNNIKIDFNIHEKINQKLFSEFPTIHRIISLCNERSEDALVSLKEEDTRNRLKQEFKTYQKNYNYLCKNLIIPRFFIWFYIFYTLFMFYLALHFPIAAVCLFAVLAVPGAYYLYNAYSSYGTHVLSPGPFPTHDELRDYIPASIEQIKQAREKKIKEKVTRGEFAVVSSQQEGEVLEDKIVFHADNILYSILTNMDSNNNCSGAIIDIVHKQAGIFKEELKKFDQEDLQNIAVASLMYGDLDVQSILGNRIAQ